jgi:hypothetical protein
LGLFSEQVAMAGESPVARGIGVSATHQDFLPRAFWKGAVVVTLPGRGGGALGVRFVVPSGACHALQVRVFGVRVVGSLGALPGSVGLAASPAAGQGEWKLVELPFYSYAQMQLMQRTPGQATCLYQPDNTVLAVDIAADGSYASRQITPDDPSGMVIIHGLQPDGVLTGWELNCGGDADHRTLLWIDPDGTKSRTLCGQIGWVVGSFEDGTIMSSAYRDNKPLIFGTRDGGRVDVSIPAEWEDSLGFNHISDGGGSGWLGGQAFKDSGQGTVVFAVIWDRSTGRFIPIDEASFGYPSGT